jgi:hypothetical protein
MYSWAKQQQPNGSADSKEAPKTMEATKEQQTR